MSEPEPDLDAVDRRVDLTLRLLSHRVLRAMNLLHLGMWRLGLGRMLNAWPRRLGRYVLITTTGRRTGRSRRTSLNFTRSGDAVYCIAGWHPRSSWYANLLAEPSVEVWLPGERRRGIGRTVEDPAEATRAMRQLLEDTRGLSKLLAGVDTDRIDEPMVAALTRRWPVVRIDLGEPQRGPGPRPGDLAWVWGAIGLIALACACRHCRRSFCSRKPTSAPTSGTSVCAFCRRPE